MRLVEKCMQGAIAVVVSVGLVACGNSGVTVDNANPKGTVGGLVLDVTTQLPLDGVAVRIQSAGGTFDSTSGTDGYFRISDVPAGGFIVELSKAGFLSTRMQGTLAGSVGNFPVQSPITTLQPIGMVSVGGDFVLRVVNGSGAPLAGVKATLRSPLTSALISNNSMSLNGSLVLSAESAADGRLTFTGLPSVAAVSALGSAQGSYDPNVGTLTADSMVVSIAPMRIASQDDYSYAGGIFRYSLLTIGNTLPQLILAGPSSAFTVVESNLEWLRDGFQNPSFGASVSGSMMDINGPITIAFSEAVNPSTLRVQVTTENGGAAPALTPTVNLNLVSLVPSAPFAAGTRYNLILHAEPALNAGSATRQRNVIAPFFTRTDPAGKPSVVSAKLTAAGSNGAIQFVLSEPIGLGDGLAQSYTCAVFYEGVNFDGSGASSPNVSGEWSFDPALLTCSVVSPVAGLSIPATNAGVLVGSENKGAPGGMPVTGYTTVFDAAFLGYTGPAPAVTAAPGSSVPVVGTKGHLFFPRLAGTVRRANGEPVADLPFTLQ